MNTRKISAIIIAVAFFCIAIFSCVALFTVRKIETVFAADEERDTEEVQDALDKFIGKNLLFLNTEEVRQSVLGFQYMEVLSVEKKFPNVVKVEIRERREIYSIISGGKRYITTADGFVLDIKDDDGTDDGKRRITLDIKRLENSTMEESDMPLENAVIGQVLSLSGEEEFLSSVFEMAKGVELTDCIKSIRVDLAYYGSQSGAKDLLVSTYTGVKIRIIDADVKGEEKIKKAFEEYDASPSDYKKMFDYIIVSEVQGEIKAVWSEHDNRPI